MSNPSLHAAKDRIDTLLAMIADDGGTPAGQLPPPDHVDALRRAPVGRAEEVRKAHAEEHGPPDFAGGPKKGKTGRGN